MRIDVLKLVNFRSVESLKLEADGAQVVALVGENGAGKTSVLEALSLLSPGAGLNKAKRQEILQHGAAQWGAHVVLADGETIGMACEKGRRTRELKVNGDTAQNQNDLMNLGTVLWFTPAMDRLFLDAAKARRDFLDRLTFALFPEHGANVNRYRHHLRSRLKLLKENADSDWLEIEEQQAADYAVQVMRDRAAYLEALAPFLKDVSLSISGSAQEVMVEERPEEAICMNWAAARERDGRYGQTHFGPHTSDLRGVLHLGEKDVVLAEASSGQHKRGLLDILLAHARLITEKTGKAPLILLDEVTAHLDAKRQGDFLANLTELGAQIWLAGTDRRVFETIENCRIFTLCEGDLVSQPIKGNP